MNQPDPPPSPPPPPSAGADHEHKTHAAGLAVRSAILIEENLKWRTTKIPTRLTKVS